MIVVLLALLLLVLVFTEQSPKATLANYAPVLRHGKAAARSSSSYPNATAGRQQPHDDTSYGITTMVYRNQLGDVTSAMKHATCAPGVVCACPNTPDFAWFPGESEAKGELYTNISSQPAYRVQSWPYLYTRAVAAAAAAWM